MTSEVEKPPSQVQQELDHIIEFAEGGLTVLENTQTLCRKHHLAKSKAYAAVRAAKKKASLLAEKKVATLPAHESTAPEGSVP